MSEMMQRSEHLLELSARNSTALFTRRPQILSATLKLLIGTTTSSGSGSDDATSAIVLVEETLRSRGDQSNIRVEDLAIPVSSEEFESSLNRSIDNILMVSSSFSAAIIDSDSDVMKLRDDGKRIDTEQTANKALEKLETKDCLKVEKYLQELSMTDSSVGNIQVADKGVMETRSNIIAFRELHSEQMESVSFLREASPVV